MTRDRSCRSPYRLYADQIGRLREAVPDMVLQIGGSISFAAEGDADAKWQGYDTRHMLAEIDPRPDQVTVAIGTSQYDLTSMMTMDDVAGTHMANPKVNHAYSNMVAEAGPDFYIEHLKRLRQHEIQPYCPHCRCALRGSTGGVAALGPPPKGRCEEIGPRSRRSCPDRQRVNPVAAARNGDVTLSCAHGPQ